MRKLPIYLLIDTSGSMEGEPIETVRKGIQLLVSTLKNDPCVLETVRLSFITFDSAVEQITPLAELHSLQLPIINAGGATSLGEALYLLSKRIDVEVVISTKEIIGDWSPLIFIMTDGIPTDDVEIGIKGLKKFKHLVITVCVVGEDADISILRKITDFVIHIDKLNSSTIESYFKWVSATVSNLSLKAKTKTISRIGFREFSSLPFDINVI